MIGKGFPAVVVLHVEGITQVVDECPEQDHKDR
jgi:hypothetical protein